MNRKQFITLIVLVAILGGVGLILKGRKESAGKANGSGVGQKLLGDFQVNDVAQIMVKEGDTSLTLEKKDNLWRVKERNGYPANYSEIAGFLMKAKDLKIVQVEEVGPSQLPRLQLAPSGAGTNSGVQIEFKDGAGKTIKAFALGKKHLQKGGQSSPLGGSEGFPDGRYVMVSGAKSVALISDPLNNIEPKAEQWLGKDFFKVEKPKSISVKFPEATNSWTLIRESESAEWKLADAKSDEKLDAGKASGVANPLSYPSFVDVISTNAPLEATGLDKPTIITVKTVDQFNYELNVGKKDGENHYMTVKVSAELPKERTPAKDEKPEDKEKLDKAFAESQKALQEKLTKEKELEKWTYLVSSWNVEPLLKPRAAMMEEKKEVENAAEPGPALPGVLPVQP